MLLTFRGGKLAKVDGGKSAEKLRKHLEDSSKKDKYGPQNVLQFSEIAVGANEHAPMAVKSPDKTWRAHANSTMETEKRRGTIHFAIASSQHGEEGTEGHNKSEYHFDFVIPRHTLTITAYYNQSDWEKKRNGTNLIDNGGWNFLS